MGVCLSVCVCVCMSMSVYVYVAVVVVLALRPLSCAAACSQGDNSRAALKLKRDKLSSVTPTRHETEVLYKIRITDSWAR